MLFCSVGQCYYSAFSLAVYVVSFYGCWFFFQAEDGIRYLVRSRGLGDVYKRQALADVADERRHVFAEPLHLLIDEATQVVACLLYTSDAADERSSVDLGGRRIIKKKKKSGSDSTHTHK